jgi:hypothetical protein
MVQDGLLWFDDHPTRPVSDKIKRAVQRYQQKYGHNPDVCYVHPAQLKEGDLSLAEDVKVLPAKSVLPHHFWLGIQSQPAEGRTRASQSSAGQSRSQRRR